MRKIFRGILVGLGALVLWSAGPALSDDTHHQGALRTIPAQEASGAVEKPADPTAASPASEQTGIRIQDAVVCHDIVNREPVGSGDVFAKEIAKVFCYCRVVGASEESSITQNWYYQGTLKASIQLPVRSRNWRTWSYKTLAPEWTGEWMVEILSAEGTPLGSIVFFVR
ncbi:MAG: DUF2914 domain-containing protein [Desulfobacteraceae bacterium]|nr:MAG: DUF2914 domain-containing protein [Desulfobacteraceae bacterium]